MVWKKATNERYLRYIKIGDVSLKLLVYKVGDYSWNGEVGGMPCTGYTLPESSAARDATMGSAERLARRILQDALSELGDTK